MAGSQLCAELMALPGVGGCAAEAAWRGLLLEVYERPLQDSDRCTSYLLLPAENTWSRGLRSVLYGGGLLYCCLGLAALTGVFMKSLEKIVTRSREVQRQNPATGLIERTQERYWNSTLANLMLLALGTSAPEVLLSLIDAIKHLGKAPGELGPGTVLGSAAFNMLVILAVCVVTPQPPPILRKIQNYAVFAVELCAALWAYLWLLLILKVTSPGRVEIWEAVLTLAQFPLFVLVAYGQDRGWKFSLWGKEAVLSPRQTVHSGAAGPVQMSPSGRGGVEGVMDSTSFALGSSLHQNLKYRARAVRLVSLSSSEAVEAKEQEVAILAREQEEGREVLANGDSHNGPEEAYKDLFVIARQGSKFRRVEAKGNQGSDAGERLTFTLPLESPSKPLRLELFYLTAGSPPEEVFLGQHTADISVLTPDMGEKASWVELLNEEGVSMGSGAMWLVLRVCEEKVKEDGMTGTELHVEIVSSSRGLPGHARSESLQDLMASHPPQSAPDISRAREWQRAKRLWCLQFEEAMTVWGGEDRNAETLEVSVVGLLFHFCSFYWKLLFAIVPPPPLLGGWAAFLSCK